MANHDPKPKSLINSLVFGFIVGIIVPFLSFYTTYIYGASRVYSNNGASLSEFYDHLRTTNILSQILGLATLPDMLVFFLFIWTNRYRGARGVLASIFIYAVMVFLYHYSE